MRYFISTLGSKGIKSFDLPFKPIKLYGYSQKSLAELFGIMINIAYSKNIKTDVVHSFINNGLKGLIFPELEKAVMNVEFYEESGLPVSIESDYSQIVGKLNDAKMHFEDALLIHDRWERYYVDNFDFSQIDEKCENLIKELFSEEKQNEKGKIFERFLGAATASGSVDYIDSITEEIKTRYFIKGRPGSGKSTFMRKILNHATDCGYDAECYYCAFDPKSIDMVVVREKNICIFDSTPPHEHFPIREGDFILDFYAPGAKCDVDTVYKEELGHISGEYKEKIKMATECIARCDKILNQNERCADLRIDRKDTTYFANYLSDKIFDESDRL
ncbi:MAG: hypothetical protein II998_03355 [Clostridia bacterium]|nr:hypothetical protein [Clostridia bacterium]